MATTHQAGGRQTYKKLKIKNLQNTDFQSFETGFDYHSTISALAFHGGVAAKSW